jgi:hypothetical protein
MFVAGARRVVLPLALLLIAGCTGTQPPTVLPNALTSSTASSPAYTVILYAATTEDSKSQEYVYGLSYPSAKFIYRLGPFSQGPSGGVPHALGLCTDPAGNLYVVDPGENSTSTVYIYKHGARHSSTMLPAQYGSDECSFDPVSGDLAVMTNTEMVQIYRHASGIHPKVYPIKHQIAAVDLAYGVGHELYFGGDDNDGYEGLTVMTPDHRQHVLRLDSRIQPGWPHLQWSAGTLIVSVAPRAKVGQVGTVIQPSGTHGHVVQTFALYRPGKRHNFNNPDLWIQGSTAIAPGYGLGTLDFWKYPQGGQPERHARVPGANVHFTSVVVSPPQ